jgi:glycosyltransferase involved in cell wall biosynthesis
MRVLHFFKTYWPDTFGGVERTIHALAKGSHAHGIQTDVLALSHNPASASFQFDGHTVHQVQCDLELASTGFSRAAFGRFADLSREADIIHYHFPWPFMDVVDLLSNHGKPIVVTYHSDIVKQKAAEHCLSSADAAVSSNSCRLHSRDLTQLSLRSSTVLQRLS